MTVIVGGESRYYNSSTASTTSALFLEAENLTPTGSSTKTAGASGASGSGSNVVRNTDLTTTYQAVLKSEIDASNAALTHKGTFRVWAKLYRPTGNTGAVSVRLEWAEGDFTRVTLNDPVAYAANDREGAFTWVNLGIVSIDPNSTRWEFRLLAKSTVVGDELDADCFVLFPTEVVYTELSGKLVFQNPSSFSARDEFNSHSAGDLTTKTAPVGGAWTGGGDTNDFSIAIVSPPVWATRDDLSDTAPRVDWLPTSLTNIVVQADVCPGTPGRTGGTTSQEGVDMAGIAAVVDADDYFSLSIKARNSERALEVGRTIGGSRTVVASMSLEGQITFNRWFRMRLHIDAAGRWWAYFAFAGDGAGTADPQPGAVPALVMSGLDTNLATGGSLATRKPGLVDYCSQNASTALPTRYYDNFLAFPPTPDMAIFAGQSLTLAHDRATREDSTGAFSTTISDRRGRYLKIPPAGPEGRSTRLVVMALANDPYTMPEAGPYDLSAQLFVTPRGLVVPEA
jgi:hypothetical protein